MEDRERFKKLLQGDTSDHLDDLDHKAVAGFKYLDPEQDFDGTMRSLDSRFQALLKTSGKPESKRVRKLPGRWMLGVAAAILLLVVSVVMLRPKAINGPQLFAAHFEVPTSPYLLTSRGADGSTMDLESAFALYAAGDFQEAAEAIGALVPLHPEREDLTFYQAVALMGAGKVDAARPLLERCLSISYQGIDQKAPLYLALVHLQLGHIDEAKGLLEESPMASGPTQRIAESLRSALQ